MSNTLVPFDISCFKDIIGLSENACQCFDANHGWDISLSGLFVDKGEGMSLKMIDAIKDCENENNLWLIMDAARSNGIRRFISDADLRLREQYDLKRPKFQGYIGEQTYTDVRNITSPYCGVWFYTSNSAGSYIHFKDITTIFSGSGTINLVIYNNLNEIVKTLTLNITNGILKNPVDFILPLWDTRTRELQYFFIYQFNSSNKPKNNQVGGCGNCGIKYTFNTSNPYFIGGSNKLAGWSKWTMVGNIETSSLDFSNVGISTSNYLNGLAFETDIYCNLSKQFCFDTPNKMDEGFMSLAFALQHITCYNLLIAIITSPNISRYTMMSGESIQALMKLHLDAYNENLKYLIASADLRNTDCLICKDKIRMGRGRL